MNVLWNNSWLNSILYFILLQQYLCTMNLKMTTLDIIIAPANTLTKW